MSEFPWLSADKTWIYALGKSPAIRKDTTQIPKWCDPKPINVRTYKKDGILWHACCDVARELGFQSTQSVTRIARPLCEFDGLDPYFRGVQSRSWYTTAEGVKMVIRNTRKYMPDKILEKYGVKRTELHECPEAKALHMIRSWFCDSISIVNHRVGKYTIDLYFPAENIAVECDEYHHRSRVKADKRRQNYLEKTYGMRFVRFKPESTADLERAILEIRRLLGTKRKRGK